MSDRPLLFAWQQAIRESDLTPTERLVALMLSTWMQIDGTGAHPGISKLCAATGRRRRDTVTAALATLERKGYLECVHRGGLNAGASSYVARLPLDTPGAQVAGHATCLAGDDACPALDTSAHPAGHLSGVSRTQDQPRARAHARERGVCPECEIGGGSHVEGCSLGTGGPR